jgi:hypothetical protein
VTTHKGLAPTRKNGEKQDSGAGLPELCQGSQASHAGGSLACGIQVGEQGLDTPPDLVADGPDLLDGEPGRVGEIPVEVALAGEDGAGVARSPW